VSAFKANQRFAEEHRNAATKAAGLRVPKAIADFLILDAIRASHGTAVAVSDEEMLEAAREIGQLEGVFVAPEGGACYAALKQLRASGHIQPEESVRPVQHRIWAKISGVLCTVVTGGRKDRILNRKSRRSQR